LAKIPGGICKKMPLFLFHINHISFRVLTLSGKSCKMKRAMIKSFNTHENHYFGELERSRNPRSEFHTVGKQEKCASSIRRLHESNKEKIKV